MEGNDDCGVRLDDGISAGWVADRLVLFTTFVEMAVRSLVTRRVICVEVGIREAEDDWRFASLMVCMVSGQ